MLSAPAGEIPTLPRIIQLIPYFRRGLSNNGCIEKMYLLDMFVLINYVLNQVKESTMAESITPLPRILIVDDEWLMVRLLDDVLKSHYQLLSATTGQEALARAFSEVPELILLDVGLPDLDGYEVCRRLRENRVTCNIPVIFLTNFDTRKEVVRGFEVGGNDYILKPFGVIELMARIDNHLGQYRETVAMEDALEQNRLLLKEANGWIKSSLSHLCSLLTLQMQQIDNKEVVHHLTLARNRISIMADIPEIVRTSGVSAGIQAASFLSGIASRLIDASGQESIRLQSDCDDEIMTVEMATACGFIVNELVAATLKDSLPDGPPGFITLTLKRDLPDLVLTVGDDGVGLWEEAGVIPVMTIVKSLVRLIDGQLSLESGQESRFVIRFPVTAGVISPTAAMLPLSP